ncbi:MAG: hypothetical protein E7307_09565 [Butyrivibrio sp.]|nr:hypothetical protein [Butyrivibrio sp.]
MNERLSPSMNQASYVLYNYVFGLVGTIVPEMAKKLNDLTGRPAEKTGFRELVIENENYTCEAYIKLIPEGTEDPGDYIGVEGMEGVMGVAPVFEIKIRDYTFERNITAELREYVEARNMHDDVESVGTCAAIAMVLDVKLNKEFDEDYAD